MRLAIYSALVIAALGGAVGCGGIADPTKNAVDTVTIAVDPGGFNYSTFNVAKTGEYSVTVVSVNPPASVFVTALLGTLSSVGCAPAGPIGRTTASHVVLSGPINAGSYCLGVSDVVDRAFTVSEIVTLQISHP
jgi:hypothetical protein